jgi:hypothetical protein
VSNCSKSAWKSISGSMMIHRRLLLPTTTSTGVYIEGHPRNTQGVATGHVFLTRLGE